MWTAEQRFRKHSGDWIAGHLLPEQADRIRTDRFPARRIATGDDAIISGAAAVLKVLDSAVGKTLATLHWLTIVVGLAENIAVIFQNIDLAFSVRVVDRKFGGRGIMPLMPIQRHELTTST